jgi:alpha-1,2-mannosyltransferase
VSAAVCCALAARSQAHFVDLRVYRMGGSAVLHGARLYQLRLVWLPFTYPPFAAVVFTGLAVVPWRVAVTVLTGASVVALPAALYLVLRLPGPSRIPARGPAWTVALAVATAAIWLEPARATLGYGQVDILLTAAVLYDLSLPDTARCKGVLIGLVAGLKLTPAIFAVYLLVTGRRRAAAIAAAAFAGTVAVGFSVFPASSAWFWSGRFASPGHVSPVQNPQNQSLYGALARAMHTAHVLPVRGDRAAYLADLLDSSLGHRHPGAASRRPGGRPCLPRRECRGGRPRHGGDRGDRRDRLDPARRGYSAFGLARSAGLGAGA